jgi:predicted MPP superfamily phosphohydrolase
LEHSSNTEAPEFVSVAVGQLSEEEDISELLQERLGRLHAKLRLGIEADHEEQVFGQGINYFHMGNLKSSHFVIRTCLRLTGLYERGCRNAAQVEIRRNYIKSTQIPKAFDGYRILQLSDLHVEMSDDAIVRSSTLLQEIDYDVCVLTGDYRAQAFGPPEVALAGMLQLCVGLKQPIYGVLGNHDTVRTLPGLERMGIRMLLNKCESINRGDQCIYIAGIDDAHFYRADNIEKAGSGIPSNAFSILLSHTPEIYQQAAHADFNVLLSGHTHGGQICLPGGIPITLDSVPPRYMGSGSWQYRNMNGYTSVGVGCSIVPARFNCQPEITLHFLQSTT